MAIKLGRVVKYNEEFLFLKFYVPWTMWFCDVSRLNILYVHLHLTNNHQNASVLTDLERLPPIN